MTPESWQQVRKIFDGAVSLPPSRIEDFLRERCKDDAELYSVVRRMLDEHERSGLLDHPPAPPPKVRVAAGFEVGAVISGRYRILRMLGHGGMGEVYEAEDLELKEHVALKTLLPAIAGDIRMIDRFKQEIQLSRKLSHPNICRVFDLARQPAEGSSSDTVFFLTMEYLPGETLSARLGRVGRIAPDEALRLLEQMAAGLEAAHTAGVIHRDFKPSNVMLAEPPARAQAILMDFGLARRVERSDESTATISGQLIGTLDYMAPELFTGGQASPASDLYALGLVAYKMVTGTFPFESSAPLAAVIRRAGSRVPPPSTKVPGLDPVWDRALARALDPDPAQRFGSVRDFIRALRGDTASVTVRLPVVTRRRAIVGVTAVATVVAAILGWHTWEQSRTAPSPEAMGLYQKGVDDIHTGAYFAATKALGRAVELAPGFSLAHARLAEAYIELDLSDKASHEMLLARRSDVSSLSRLERLQLEAIDLTITREFGTAVGRYEQMLASPDGGELAVDLGRAYEKAGKTEKAIESYARAASGPGQHPAAWLRLGMLYNRTGNVARSDDAFNQAEQLYQLTSNLEGLTEVAFQRAVVGTARGKFAEASSYLQTALATSRLVGNIHQDIRARLQLGVNAYATGNAPLSEQYAHEALEIARANRVEPLAIRGLVTLGLSYQRKRAYDGAESYLKEALGLARAANAARFIALTQFALAALHDEISKPELTEPEAVEALSFYQASGYAKETFQCLTLIGRAHGKRGDSDRALKDYQAALFVAEKTQDRTLMDPAEESMGTVLSELQRYPESLPHFQKELSLSLTPERRGYAELHLGHTLWILGRYEEAYRALASAESDTEKVLSLRITLSRDRAYMELSRGNFSQSAAFARKVLAEDTGQNPHTNSEIARILGLGFLRSGNTAEGLKRCRESFEIAGHLNDSAVLLDARLAFGETLLASGDRSAALRLLSDGEPVMSRYPEFRWRVLALMARADPQYLASARTALDEIRHAWGEPAFAAYCGRPDLAPLARPLFESSSATTIRRVP